MRIAVISDIHGNSIALKSVISQIREQDHKNADAVRCLGDIFGYFAQPIDVWRTVSELDPQMRLGNHDVYIREMLVENRGGLGVHENDIVAWTNLMHLAQVQSSREHASIKSYLERTDPFLPRIEVIDDYAFIYVHGSLVDPPRLPTYDYTYTYLKPSIDRANRANLIRTIEWAQSYAETQPNFRILVFVGHTHLPMIAYLDDGQLCFQGGMWSTSLSDAPIDLNPLFQRSRVVVVNGGAVGESRAMNTQAQWAHFDTKTGFLRMFSHPISGRALQELSDVMNEWKRSDVPDEVLSRIRDWYNRKSGGLAESPYHVKANLGDDDLHGEWQNIVEALLNRYLNHYDRSSLTDAYIYTDAGFSTR